MPDLQPHSPAMGTRVGQPGVDARADLNGDGVVNIRDLSAVSQILATSARCK